MSNNRHEIAHSVFCAEPHAYSVERGLSKREYAAIQIAAGLAANARPQMSYTVDRNDIYIIPNDLAKQAVEITDELFNQLEK